MGLEFFSTPATAWFFIPSFHDFPLRYLSVPAARSRAYLDHSVDDIDAPGGLECTRQILPLTSFPVIVYFRCLINCSRTVERFARRSPSGTGWLKMFPPIWTINWNRQRQSKFHFFSFILNLTRGGYLIFLTLCSNRVSWYSNRPCRDKNSPRLLRFIRKCGQK